MDNRRIARELLYVARLLEAANSMNVKSVSLSKAREYAEEQFEKAGKDLDVELPDFDKNYKLLQKKMGAAKNISRIDMPVIDPQDMKLFNERLNSGEIDIFKPYAKGKEYMPKSLPKEEGQVWVHLGKEDGNPNDDKVKGKIGTTPAKDLLPLQGEIWLEKLIGNIVKFGAPSSGSPILKATIIVSSDNYILDGHHRFGQAMLANPNLKLKSLNVDLPIDKLLKVGKTYGEAIGNSGRQ